MTKFKSNLSIEDHGNDFSYQKKKTGLNIQFNRVAFIFFVFFIIYAPNEKAKALFAIGF